MAQKKEEVKEVVKKDTVVKTPVKAEETKAAPAKEPVKAEPKKEPAVKEEVKAEAPKKRGRKPGSKKVSTVAKEIKKSVAKSVSKRTAKKEELTPEVYLQYKGGEAGMSEMIDKIKQQFINEGHRAGNIKTLQVYLKPEENAIYYVINEKNAGKVDMF